MSETNMSLSDAQNMSLSGLTRQSFKETSRHSELVSESADEIARHSEQREESACRYLLKKFPDLAEGVEWKTFTSLCKYVRGVTYNKNDEIKKGTDGTKVLRANNITLDSNVLNFDEVKIIDKDVKIKPEQWLKKNDILICAGSGSKEHIGKVAYLFEDIDYTFGGFMGVIRSISDSLDSRYLFFILTSPIFREHLRKTSAASSSTINNINNDTWKDFQFPLPPLAVQQEIVRILDKFTELERNLEKELVLRRKQYEYYRDKLILGNSKQNTENSKVEWKTLGEIGKVCMCKRIMKNQTSASGDVPFYKIGTFGKTADAYISKELFEEYKQKYSYPKKGSILISAAGTIGRTVIFDGEPAYFQDSNIVWIDNDESQALNKYLFYCYQMNPWKIQEGGTISRLYNDNITNAIIPLPPLSEQTRIVQILDKFESLTNSLTSGIPAEIALRKKQYEYYRDLLLTFKRK